MTAAALQLSIMLVLVLGAVLLFTLWVRISTSGKMLCFFLEPNRMSKPKLLKTIGDYVYLGKEPYAIDSDCIRYVRYPTGWPSMFQIPVPCSLYEIGRFTPLNWNDLGEPGVTSREVGAVLDPDWLALIVRGTKEGQISTDKNLKLLMMICAAVSIIGMILTFYVITRIMSIESAVSKLHGA